MAKCQTRVTKGGQKSVQYGIDSFANGTTKCWETKGWEHNGDGKHKRDIQTLESLEWEKEKLEEKEFD
jgi:hypothetical protein